MRLVLSQRFVANIWATLELWRRRRSIKADDFLLLHDLSFFDRFKENSMSRRLSFWLQIVRSHQSRMLLMCCCCFCLYMPCRCRWINTAARKWYRVFAPPHMHCRPIIIMNYFPRRERASRDMKYRALFYFGEHQRDHINSYTLRSITIAHAVALTHFMISLVPMPSQDHMCETGFCLNTFVCISFVYLATFFFLSRTFFAISVNQIEPMTSKMSAHSERVKLPNHESNAIEQWNHHPQ